MTMDVKYCRNCGRKVKVETVFLGYDEMTRESVSRSICYCPTLSLDTIRKAYLNGTLCLGGYYHKNHYLQELEKE